jgi:hypothetical protein
MFDDYTEADLEAGRRALGGGSDLYLPILYAGSHTAHSGPSGASVMLVAQVLGRFILDGCDPAE